MVAILNCLHTRIVWGAFTGADLAGWAGALGKLFPSPTGRFTTSCQPAASKQQTTLAPDSGIGAVKSGCEEAEALYSPQ